MKQYSVSLIFLKSDRIVDAKMLVSEENQIELEIVIFDVSYKSTGTDLIDCLQKLRAEKLEPMDAYLLINACKINFHSSRMQRQMSQGMFGYLLEKGKQAKLVDQVCSLDAADFSTIGSIAQQESFYGEWINALSRSHES